MDENKNAIGLELKLDGFDVFMGQIAELEAAIETLTDKLSELAKVADGISVPLTIVHNHYSSDES